MSERIPAGVIETGDRGQGYLTQYMDIYSALVEIITNCDDSYHRMSRDNGKILIQIVRRRKRPSLVIVRDRAEGMTDYEMHEKLREVGNRTGGEGSRGFIGRGLRDARGLGDITVESIKNEQHFKCQLLQKLNEDGHNYIPFEGGKVNNSLRERLGIKKDGTVVTLAYNPAKHPKSLPTFDRLIKNLEQHFALRDILSPNRKGQVTAQEGNKKHTLSYTPPPGEQVINESFEVPGYPGANCRIRIWKSENALEDPQRPHMRKSGILIVGQRAIHQCNLLDYERGRDAELAACYYGRLDCDYIQSLLEEFDDCLTTERKHPKSNPSLLIDPFRQKGMEENHPFTKALFLEVNQRLKALIESDKERPQPERGDVTSAKMRERLSQLAKLANKFLRDHVDEIPEGDQKAIDAAIKKGIHIIPPKFTVGINKTHSLTVYAREDHYSPERRTRVDSDDKKVIVIKKRLPGGSLRQHPRKPGVFYGSFTVQGLSLGTANIIVRPSKQTKATVAGTVVKTHDPSRPDFQYPIKFENENYRITEGKSKIVKVFAEVAKMPKGDLVAIVSCPDDKKNSLAIRSGGKCSLNVVPGTDYAEGKIQITGREVTPRALTLYAQIADFSTTAKIRIRPPGVQKGGFSFRLVGDELGLVESRAEWDIENDPNRLLIAATHPSIKQYFGDPPEFAGQNDKSARAVLAEIIAENVCLRVLDEEMIQKSGDFDYAGDEPHEVLRKIRRDLRGKIHRFSVQTHKILVGRS